MTGSSLLPVTIYQDRLLFLFGKENEMEDSAKGFSDFGGSVETGESIFRAALREGSEELTGFLGDEHDLKRHIDRHGGTFTLCIDDYHVHLFYLPYDPNLPTYYNRNHAFLWDRMNKNTLNESKLFEKIKIEWFSIIDIKQRRKEFRSFYQKITDEFVRRKDSIKRFLIKKRKTRRKI